MLYSSKSKQIFFLKGMTLIVMMLAARIWITGQMAFLFLLWNLVLAYLPFAISNYIINRKHIQKPTFLILAVCWLLFFPNAPYLITDLIHLKQRTAPLWFDAALLFLAAINGLWIGCLSLVQMEKKWQLFFPAIKPVFFTGAVMLLSGFGVYLGRVLRFNSWDIVSNPFVLLSAVLKRIVFPWQYIYTWEITLLFAAILFVCYQQFKAIRAG